MLLHQTSIQQLPPVRLHQIQVQLACGVAMSGSSLIQKEQRIFQVQ